MKVLYVSHTSLVSGGERSMLDLLGALPSDVQSILATPSGPLADLAIQMGIEIVPIPGTDGSLALHPIHTPRALAALVHAAIVVRKAAARAGVDLMHANSIRAGIIVAMARRLGGPPAISSVRDVLPAARAAVIAQRFVGAGVDIAVANSAYTGQKFLQAAPRAQVKTVFPPVNLARFDPGLRSNTETRASIGVPVRALILSIIAQITPWKGQLEAIEIFASVHKHYPEACLLIVGEVKFSSAATRYDNHAYMETLQCRVRELNISSSVLFLGERADVEEVLACTDIVLAPSHEEPFGRSVIEAMAMECTVLAAKPGGPAEIIDDTSDGFLIDQAALSTWAELVCDLIATPTRRVEIGRRARHTVEERFTLQAHVDRMMAIYAEASDRWPEAICKEHQITADKPI
jgi:glycosyltransferase involved in cell wall biosynthesis